MNSNQIKNAIIIFSTFIILISVSMLIANFVINPLVNIQNANSSVFVWLLYVTFISFLAFHFQFEFKELKKRQILEGLSVSSIKNISHVFKSLILKIFFRFFRVLLFLIFLFIVIGTVILAIYLNSLLRNGH